MTFVIKKMLLELLFHFPQKYVDNHILQTITLISLRKLANSGRGMYCKIQDNLLCIERQKYCINKALIFVHFLKEVRNMVWSEGIVCCYYSVLQVVAKYYTFYTSRESNSKVNKRYALNGKDWLKVIFATYCVFFLDISVQQLICLVVIIVASSALLSEFC